MSFDAITSYPIVPTPATVEHGGLRNANNEPEATYGDDCGLLGPTAHTGYGHTTVQLDGTLRPVLDSRPYQHLRADLRAPGKVIAEIGRKLYDFDPRTGLPYYVDGAPALLLDLAGHPTLRFIGATPDKYLFTAARQVDSTAFATDLVSWSRDPAAPQIPNYEDYGAFSHLSAKEYVAQVSPTGEPDTCWIIGHAIAYFAGLQVGIGSHTLTATKYDYVRKRVIEERYLTQPDRTANNEGAYRLTHGWWSPRFQVFLAVSAASNSNAPDRLYLYEPVIRPAVLLAPELTQAGSTTTARARVLGDWNEPCPNVPVAWSADNGGTWLDAVTRTDGAGWATGTYLQPPGATGDFTITATVDWS